MNVTIPKGWHQVPLGEPVFHHDLIWDVYDPKWTTRRGWMHVKKFGSFCKSNTNKYVIRQDDVQDRLMMALRHFPYKCYSMDYMHGKEYLTAYVLFLAGVEEITSGVRYMSGKKELENIILDHNSFSATPYIELPVTNGVNLLWYLLKKMNIAYSGGASSDIGKSYMQASWYDKDNFIPKMIAYFNVMVKEFDKLRR